MPNHLVHENSPYLLQHSNNPVDWYPWCADALKRALTEDKPIFLSIGYAACHWCHVMEHESFENQSTAAIMNESFINIKVDREERPDLDSIYMAATVAMTGSGGWPMSVFLTPDLRPFYAGTYFPPEARFNMPAFRELLKGITNAWKTQRDEIARVGEQVTQYIQKASDHQGNQAWAFSQNTLNQATDNILKSYDWGFGGWGEAPRFPQPMTIEFLLYQVAGIRGEKSELAEKAVKAVRHSLQAMSRGGMYDVIGGGFSRYSVDNLWKTPHFEKMLYDNAQLAKTYLHAYLETGQIEFRDACEETLDFLLREMTHPEGGFYSSLDADSEGKEGKFYTWTYTEIQSALGSEMKFFEAAYGLSKKRQTSGEEHEIILQRALDDKTLATHFNITVEELKTKLKFCHSRLLHERNKRTRPGTDDKILTGWNALALTAFAEAGRYLARQDYLKAAVQNASFLLESLQSNGRLHRSWREGQTRQNAFLEDYAALILGLLALYQSVPDQKWYSNALRLADDMLIRFADPQGGFFDTSCDHENLLLRPKDIQDNATPSGNALAAMAMLQLAEYGDRPAWQKMANDMLALVMETAIRYPTAFAMWLCAADFSSKPTTQVAIIGSSEKPEMVALLNILWQHYNPHQIIAISREPVKDGIPSILNDRPLKNGLPTAYVCHGFVCQEPVNLPIELSRLLTNK